MSLLLGVSSLIAALWVVINPKYFFKKKGQICYQFIIAWLPIPLLANLFLLEGYYKPYISQLSTLGCLQVLLTSLQAG